jgi:hypothetical protein
MDECLQGLLHILPNCLPQSLHQLPQLPLQQGSNPKQVKFPDPLSVELSSTSYSLHLVRFLPWAWHRLGLLYFLLSSCLQKTPWEAQYSFQCAFLGLGKKELWAYFSLGPVVLIDLLGPLLAVVGCLVLYYWLDTLIISLCLQHWESIPAQGFKSQIKHKQEL